MFGSRSSWATTPYVDISSAGPLIHILIGNDISFQVEHTTHSPTLEFYPQFSPADAGTFIFTSGTLYAPDFSNHDITSTDNIGTNTPFTAVSQTAVTGTGTSIDPYTVVTVVTVGATGLVVTETDTYVVGTEYFITSTNISNTSISTATGVIYRAGDSDIPASGYGFTQVFSGNNSVGTSLNANNSSPGDVIEWIPLTASNNYMEDAYDTVWTTVGGHSSFPDSCQCTTLLDVGAGISWSFSISASASATFANITKISPSGVEATPTPTPTPTSTPTPTPTASPSTTPTATPTAIPNAWFLFYPH